MLSIEKIPLSIARRPILVMNGKIHRHWAGQIPRKTAVSPIPDGTTALVESSSDGPVVIDVDTKLSVMRPGSRHVLRFWFRGDQIKLSASKTRRLIVCANGPYQGIEPLTIRE
jgi:hypothetical protein